MGVKLSWVAIPKMGSVFLLLFYFLLVWVELKMGSANLLLIGVAKNPLPRGKIL